MSYYHRFGFVLKNPIFHWYIRNAYRQGVASLKNLVFTPNFGKEGFTALLCGVGNEGTADEFIKFNLEKNPTAKIRIIDLGQEQVEAVQRLVKEHYSNLDIEVKQLNASDLETYLPPESLDWIETDFLFLFFDNPSLKNLISIWSHLLRPDGFITTRTFTPENRFESSLIQYALDLGEIWLGAKFHLQNQKELETMFSQNNLAFTEDKVWHLSFAKSFTLSKISKL